MSAPDFDRFAYDSQDFEDYHALARGCDGWDRAARALDAFEYDDDDGALPGFDNLFATQCNARGEALRRIEAMARAFVEDVLFGASDARAADSIENAPATKSGSVGVSVGAAYEGDGTTFERFWDVADVLARGLRRSNCESSMTLRELYYVMNARSAPKRTSEKQLQATIRKLSLALSAPRCALGIIATSKGMVCGRCHIETASGQRFDCTAEGWPISGDLFELDACSIHSDAAYVIVVEKDAVFNKLCAERIYEYLPCVLITAKGYPDVATRKFLWLLETVLEGSGAKFFGLVDWNPHGAWILATYSSGSKRSSIDAAEFVVPLTWIGLRSEDLRDVAADAMQDLTTRDAALIRNALEGDDAHPLCSFREELRIMHDVGKKADIEALYAGRSDDFFLTDYVSKKIAAREV
ncbi:Spo11/DNA topoisomerase VI, subunit A [Ostreococcus tauri]|uniref:Putative SPO11 protein n=1 Tax=Ostreococcus tauri TaxID=70448 RepID=Q00XE2_OSTTA|nr:Spo11/DNA topoisomerase VI, subunit A [Ostreococcus tauri]OUS46152.1 putative SPO11 protein [Ostreococcus tauri]CAL56369.1 Spo11/DNA topoisomerase VI, subunit A [Ostreococcus tauri]|eukprot:XP_003082512.1 Spo11/DNA topoisomerase VI, subunit A [Ostreococcus tauri]